MRVNGKFVVVFAAVILFLLGAKLLSGVLAQVNPFTEENIPAGSSVQSAQSPTTTPQAIQEILGTAGEEEETAEVSEELASRVGQWELHDINVEDDPIVAGWLSRLRVPAPELWPTFPNVPNPLVPEFRVVNGNQVPDGMEYGEDESPFGESGPTDWVVPAWHYRLISGDYEFTSDDFSYRCVNEEGQARRGCLIVLINVMNESYIWRDQFVDNGFTVVGRYWNGDTLEWGVWGLVSHASANMLNMATMRNPLTGDVLNAGTGSSANAGTNCGVQPIACDLVDVTVVVHAGDRIIDVAQTAVAAPAG